MSFSLTVRSNVFELDRQPCDDVTFEEARTFDFYQPKYDGIWGCLFRVFDSVQITSRNGLVKGHYKSNNFPHDTIVVGEYMFGTNWAQEPARAGKFFAFDLLCLCGHDMRGESYEIRLRELRNLLANLDIQEVLPVSCHPIIHLKESLDKLKLTRAYEGVVVRNWNQPFSHSLGRIKLDIEGDFVVMGFKEGTGRLTGSLGSISVGAYTPTGDLVPVMDVGGGISDSLRRTIWHDQQRFLHSVVRVVGKGRFPSGALRHPNLLNFRDDKSPRECTLIKQSLSAQTE